MSTSRWQHGHSVQHASGVVQPIGVHAVVELHEVRVQRDDRHAMRRCLGDDCMNGRNDKARNCEESTSYHTSLSSTSKVTGCHRRPKQKLVTECHHYNARPIYGLDSYVRPVLFFIAECGIVCFLCMLCTYSTFGHHPHPLGYHCAKFHFYHTLHCWASPGRKIVYSITQSLTQSITQLNWFAGNRNL